MRFVIGAIRAIFPKYLLGVDTMSKALALASLFSADLIASQFDAQCEAQAAQGRTYGPLLTMLDGGYGLAIPAGTASAIKFLNRNLFALEKMPKLAEGIGAVAATVTVTQALHAYALALRDGISEAKRAECETVTALPAWADPVVIAKAKAERKAKQAAKKVDADGAKAAASVVDVVAANIVADNSEAVDSEEMARDMHADALAAWAKFEAFLSFGVITASERDSMVAKLEKAATMAESAPAKAKRAKAVIAQAPAALM